METGPLPTRPANGALYRTLWRWHFYAGLFVIPFVITLALSGTAFLFKPQIERWEERAFRELPTQGAVGPGRQVEAALAAHPGARFHSYRLPRLPSDAARITLQDGGMRDVFVAPDGTVVGSLDAAWRPVELARRIHSELLLGPRASWLVELAACWAIVMVITGLYLWWPRGRGPAGVLWPRRKSLLRDLHAVTGFWVAALALVLLLTGLPWTSVWGDAFGTLRTQMGWVKGAPQWNTGAPQEEGGAHGAHHAQQPPAPQGTGYALARLDDVVARVAHEPLAFPAVVLAPGAALFGPPSPDWTVTSLAQNRSLGLKLTFEAATAQPLTREAFADRHPIDRVIGYGQAWHEGALFGAVNQAIGVLTAAGLVTLGITGFLVWRRRRPAGQLGAPPLPLGSRAPSWVPVVVLALAALLPLLAASLVLLWLVDVVLPRVSPDAARWLGLRREQRAP